MDDISSPPHISQKIPYWKQLLIFLKFKLIKVILKIVILISLVWFFSGTWLGDTLKPIARLAYGSVWQIAHKVVLTTKTTGQVCLVIALGLVILGKPIWKILYLLIVLALVALGIEHFVLKN